MISESVHHPKSTTQTRKIENKMAKPTPHTYRLLLHAVDYSDAIFTTQGEGAMFPGTTLRVPHVDWVNSGRPVEVEIMLPTGDVWPFDKPSE